MAFEWKTNPNLPDPKWFLPLVIIFSITFFFIVAVFADTASWYDRASCQREGTSGIMANGKELRDEALTCASWDYAFGTYLRVSNIDNGKSVVVVVSDRGPAKRLYNKGRKIDLSRAAFRAIADLKRGVIKVAIKEVR